MNLLDQITSDLLKVQAAARANNDENAAALIVQILLKISVIPTEFGVEPEPEEAPVVHEPIPVEHMTDDELEAATAPEPTHPVEPTIEETHTIPSEPEIPLPPQPAPEEPPVTGPTPAAKSPLV